MNQRTMIRPDEYQRDPNADHYLITPKGMFSVDAYGVRRRLKRRRLVSALRRWLS